MRAGWIGNVELQKRVSRSDPDARLIVQAAVTSAEDVKDTRDDWGTLITNPGVEFLDEGGIRVLGTDATELDHAGDETSDATDVRATALGIEEPRDVGVVEWGNPGFSHEIEIHSVIARLVSRDDAGDPAEISEWRAQLFRAIEDVTRRCSLPPS